ncbi:protein psbN [Richelia sinica FACHB-800]|jgi:PsbN protein|uniref:Protein PsbN n=1 Tax=Richelia sinica FACHB-800 TaxID=1357546 RepID=A0A975T4U5_9NOST|nr:photosystem II reaction center protein PsbN [Richelia sinica]MBD2664420.1 photosystem II reaction center protein PsbN [Richelia sinica FACHB-800]QXE22177.1 protein psbN [Richelia sinica FACHB-800]
MDLDPGIVLGVSLSAILIAITGMAIYTSFGPPSKELADPFEDHED